MFGFRPVARPADARFFVPRALRLMRFFEKAVAAEEESGTENACARLRPDSTGGEAGAIVRATRRRSRFGGSVRGIFEHSGSCGLLKSLQRLRPV